MSTVINRARPPIANGLRNGNPGRERHCGGENRLAFRECGDVVENIGDFGAVDIICEILEPVGGRTCVGLKVRSSSTSSPNARVEPATAKIFSAPACLPDAMTVEASERTS